MLSIIVIGRNEAETLANCFKSIYHFLDINNLAEYEIVYIDSDSTDSSIEVAKKNNIDKIFKLKGGYNTPIAMNTGVKNARYDTVLILAGDMQLCKFNFHELANKLSQDNIVTGDLKEYLFKNDRLFSTYIRNYPKKMCGGVCFIKKKLFFNIGGMDEKMTKGQDYDFFIRAAKKGFPLLKIDEIICEHYTESYTSKNRLWYTSTEHAKYRAYLLRKNIFSSSAWKLVLKEFYPIIITTGLTISAIFLSNYFLFLALGWMLFMSLYKSRNDLRVDVFLSNIIKNIIFIVSLFTFFPMPRRYEIEVIDRN